MRVSDFVYSNVVQLFYIVLFHDPIVFKIPHLSKFGICCFFHFMFVEREIIRNDNAYSIFCLM